MPKITLSKGFQPMVNHIIDVLKTSLTGRISDLEENAVLYIHTFEELGTVGIAIKFSETNEKPHDKKPVSRGVLYAHIKCIDPHGIKIEGSNGILKVTIDEKQGNSKQIKPDTDRIIDFMTDLIMLAKSVLEIKKIKEIGHQEARYMIQRSGQKYEGHFRHQAKASYYSVIDPETLIPHVRVELQFPADNIAEFFAAMNLVKGNNVNS